MHNPLDVSVKMLQEAKRQGKELSNLQLQKLVYIAHGFSLALLNRPLLNEPVEVWRYGPVISSIYHQYKEFGANKIQAPGVDLIKLDGFDKEEEEIIRGVLDFYGQFPAMNLVERTHRSQTPWHIVWHERGGKDNMFEPIPNDLIRNHYMKIVSKNLDMGSL